MVLIMNEVSINVDTKRRKTIFLLNEEGCSTVAITVSSMFGKDGVTVFKFDSETTPFSLTEKEWYAMVNHTPNISEHLNRLESNKASVNEEIQDRITSFSEQAESAQVYDRLTDEINAFMRSSSV